MINIEKNFWLRKINIDKWEKLFDRSADRKYCNIPWQVTFKETFQENREKIYQELSLKILKYSNS